MDRVELEAGTKDYSGVHDVALIRTKEPMPLEDTIRPVCLPFNTGMKEIQRRGLVDVFQMLMNFFFVDGMANETMMLEIKFLIVLMS